VFIRVIGGYFSGWVELSREIKKPPGLGGSLALSLMIQFKRLDDRPRSSAGKSRGIF
jgi:hypothetical protein